ncbi:MAG: membrane-bound lytic murein transglycosylase MltF [Xanthomonadales bacterium]|nr:membrane-bound lytic murein transglycosylase MltF [Xanthomonadales bacterium]
MALAGVLLCVLVVSAMLGGRPQAATAPEVTEPADAPKLTRLEQVRERGRLIVLTRNGASSYFIDANGPTGPEYALAEGLADRLDVELEVRVAGAFDELSAMLDQGQGDLIAANLSRTASREQQFRFALPYADTHTRVVVRRGLRVPESIADLEGLRGVVLAGSSYEEQLLEATGTGTPLEWEARRDLGVEEMLHAVAEGEYEFTLVDERIFGLHRRYYPGISEAFVLGEGQQLAWAFTRDDDDSLVQAADLYLRQAREDGTLLAIESEFFTPAEPLDTVDMMHFQARMRERLPHYLPFFQEAALDHDIDWRLLAAMGYQESHWEPTATSPTGVRGVMMLTLNTARSLGVDDRLDPLQSIRGGAEYFVRLRDRLPESITGEDRTWMALAAYNMGLGHLYDARRLTRTQGGDPNRWEDVRERLPMLSQEKYFKHTRYGYARGYQAQHYVDNIQRFLDTLIWMDTRSHPLLAEQMIAAP